MSSSLAIIPSSPIQQFFEFIAQGDLEAVNQSLTLNNFNLAEKFNWPTTIHTKYVSVKSTPMCCACYFGHVHIIEYFASKGSLLYYNSGLTNKRFHSEYINKKNNVRNAYPCYFAVKNDQLNVVVLALETFPLPQTDDEFQKFLEQTMKISTRKGYADIVAYCLTFQTIIDKIKTGTEYLRTAINQKYPDIAKLIIDAGGAVNLSHDEENSRNYIISPLRLCVRNNDIQTMRYLWMTGTLVIKSKELLLSNAVSKKSVEALRILFDEFCIDCREPRHKIIRLDSESDLFFDAIRDARDNTDLECAKILLDRKINLKNAKNYPDLRWYINQHQGIKTYLGKYVTEKGLAEYYPELFNMPKRRV